LRRANLHLSYSTASKMLIYLHSEILSAFVAHGDDGLLRDQQAMDDRADLVLPPVVVVDGRVPGLAQ
ncbi:hypothetical protein ABZ922_43560, partial [Streptomyces shenzhenensis]|uniref:hypothetical protein n=1 Tax=Streptomyces shenzhenensis TaxID=943815 RepID=UPI0033E5A321